MSGTTKILSLSIYWAGRTLRTDETGRKRNACERFSSSRTKALTSKRKEG